MQAQRWTNAAYARWTNVAYVSQTLGYSCDMGAQQTQDGKSMLVQHWSTVYDVELALNQHSFNILRLLGSIDATELSGVQCELGVRAGESQRRACMLSVWHLASPARNRFQPQIDPVQNRGSFLWTAISKTSSRIIR